MHNPPNYSSIFKKFQGSQRFILNNADSLQLNKFSDERVRIITTEEYFNFFLEFLLFNKEKKEKNENYINFSTKIDFSKLVLIVSFESIIKNVYNSDYGYIMEFQQELRGYSDHFYSIIASKNIKAEDLFYINTKIGPYLDTKYYPENLNNMIDIFQNLNHKGSFCVDLKREISTMINSSQNSKMTTQQSFNCELKLGKIVIVGGEHDDEFKENILVDHSHITKIKKRANKSNDLNLKNNKITKNSNKKEKKSANKKIYSN